MKKASMVVIALVMAVTVVFAGACNEQQKHVHSYGEWQQITAATCTQEGEKRQQCECGDFKSQTIQKTEHSFSDWQIVKEASSSEEGEKKRVCSVCEFNETQKIEKKQEEKEDNPIIIEDENIITTEQQLIDAMNDEKGGEYTLGADVSLTKKWNTVGKFKGTLDGKGYSIINMDVQSRIMEIDGDKIEFMVAFIAKNEGVVKNVNFKNLKINVTEESVDGAGYGEMRLMSQVAITNLDVHVGIVGLNKGTMENVVAEINYNVVPKTTDSRVRVGGIAGKNNATITNCITTGVIKAQESGGYIRAGGIVGYMSDNALIKGSESSVNIEAINFVAKTQVGGIVGNIENGVVEKCYYKGNIKIENTDKATSAGGIVGIIDNLSSKYEVMKIEIRDCYAAADVRDSGIKGGVGGLIGEIESDVTTSKSILITGCTAIGKASGAKDSGGFIGDLSLTDGNKNKLKLPLTGAIKDNYVFSDNYCVEQDKYATVVSAGQIRKPTGFTLAK